MKMIKSAIIAFMMPLTFNVLALDLSIDSGTLSTHSISDLNVSTLSINGTMNAADFNYISDNISQLTALKTLDLSGVTITSYSGSRVLTGGTEYPANELPAYGLMSVTAEEIILPANLTTIGEGALANSSIKTITIPASVTAIANYAFAGCANLTAVNVPASVTSLGEGLFMNCSSLSTATIASPVDVIAERMFEGCTSLSEVTYASNVNSISQQAFMNCKSLTAFNFPTTLKNIGKQAFYQSGIESVSLEKCAALDAIGDYAFAKCQSLASVNIGDHSVEMGEGVFFDDNALATVILPASTTVIPAFTFKGTTSIDVNTALPDNVEEIGEYALSGWASISSFTFPLSIQKIDDYAMSDWTFVSDDADNILFHAEQLNTVPELGENVFDGMPEKGATLKVKNTDLVETYKENPQFDNKFIIVAETTSVIENVLDNTDKSASIDFSFAGKTLIISSRGSDIASVSIYDIEGKRVYSKTSKGRSVEIDTSAWNRMVIIADVTLEDNTRTAIKISRN